MPQKTRIARSRACPLVFAKGSNPSLSARPKHAKAEGKPRCGRESVRRDAPRCGKVATKLPQGARDGENSARFSLREAENARRRMKTVKNISYVTDAGHAHKPFCVCVTINGKRRREFFATEAEARRRLASIRSEQKLFGAEATNMPARERAEFVTAKHILARARLDGSPSVLDAVRAYVERAVRERADARERERRKTAPSPEAALALYLETKAASGRSEYTQRDARLRVGRFVRELHCRRIALSAIAPHDVEAFCVRPNVSARTCRNDFAAVAAFLRFCARRGWLTFEPGAALDPKAFLPRVLAKAKTVFSLAETRHFFDELERSPRFRRLIPFYALEFFCGIRRAEAERMRWKWIDVSRKEIRLPAEITKTGEEFVLRAPFLPPTVFAWIRAYRGAGAVAEDGRVAAPTKREHDVIERVCGWRRNVARHTFATMHVSLYGNAAKTAVLLRHRNQERLWRNYLASLVPESDARAYFGLAPRIAPEHNSEETTR